ncbi:MAG: ABC transporter permease [Candidatus Bathyarchaeota archaeon]|nr:ABC transporter permease [Candidatus Bathyarchaeota archaeon]
MRSAFYITGIIALTVSAIFLLTSLSLGIDLVEIFALFLGSTVGSLDSILQTLARATPILISTLGLLVAFNGGIWNIGGEGQIVVGAIVTVGTCLFLGLPPPLAIVLSLAGSFLASGIYGAFAAFLKARWDVNEVVITMMQNFVAFAILQYLIDGPWNWGVGLYPRTTMIPPETRLSFIMSPLNSMFLIALALVAATYILLNRTVLGYEIRATGANKMAALTNGIDTERLTVLSMLLSGGICGLAGSGLVLGTFFRAQAGISGNYGFYAIASAFIAGNRALLAPLSSLLIALIYEGTLSLVALGIPHRLSEAMVGIVFLVVLLPKAAGWLREVNESDAAD